MDQPKSKRLSELLRERFDSFSPSQKAIARYVIDHLEEAGYLSAEELGREGGTSSSTVVRFAQSLGFSGYPDLQKAARDEHRFKAGARPVVRDDQLLFMVEEDLLTRALRTDILSLEETLAKNTLEVFNEAVDLLVKARQLVVVGMSEAAAVAHHAVGIFEILGFTALAMTHESEAGFARLLRLDSGDALIAIGFRRTHPLTVSLAERAAARGLSVVAITDNSLSTLAGKGNITLFVDIDSTFFVHSMVGPLSMISALAAAVYARDREGHDARVKLMRDQARESVWLR